MATAEEYFGNVSEIQNDVATAKTISGDIGTVLDSATTVLELPGKIESQLRAPANAINLPDPLVTVLGLAPYGIGTAIKTLDRIADETAAVINQQADIMGALDASWSVPRTAVDAASTANTVVGGALDALGIEHSVRVDEAQFLVDSIGGQQILDTSELALRMGAYNTAAEGWIATRDAVLAPLQAAMTTLQQAIATLQNALPDLSVIGNVSSTIVGLFQPVADAMAALENALCVVFTITPAIVIPPIVVPPVVVGGITIIPGYTIPGYTIPAVTVDICGILNDIGNQIGVVQDFVENTIVSLLNSLGFDLFGVINGLKDAMLSPLQPIFDAIDALAVAAQPLLDALSVAINEVQQQFDNVIAQLSDLVDFGSLFANTIYGDEAPGLIAFADTLDGTDSEDGIYGLEGNDVLNGLGGDDFLFGGAADDELRGGTGNDEGYGGAGNDTILGEFGSDLADGGAGNDVLVGGAGSDILIGGADTDIVLGGGGADDIHFNFGDGVDLVFGFEDDLDELYIDTALTAGVTTGQQVVDGHALSFGNLTLLNFGADKILLIGVGDASTLADDIVLV